MTEDNAEPQRFRLVALDIDGTLLDPHERLTPRTLNAVRAVELVGVTVALATSRRWTSAAPFAGRLWPPTDGDDGAVAPAMPTHTLILCDGALIRSYPDGELLQATLLPAAVAQAAAETLARHGLPVKAQYAASDDATADYVVADVNPAHPEWSSTYLHDYHRQTTFAPIDELCAGRPDALRLRAFGPTAQLHTLADELASLGCGSQIISNDMYAIGEMMVFAANASKGAALAWLAERLGVAPAETLAIGDGVNDVSMLRFAGLGVAMGNAIPAALAAADVVTAPNTADGVAEALDRYILTPEWTAHTLVGRQKSPHRV